MTLHPIPLNFLMYDENFIFLFFSVGALDIQFKKYNQEERSLSYLTQNWLHEGSAWKGTFSGSVCVKKFLFKDDIRLNNSFSGIKYFCYMRSLQLCANPSG